MKRFSRSKRSASILLALALLPLAAGGRGDDTTDVMDDPPALAQPAGGPSVQTGPADTIDISFANGIITVKPDSHHIGRTQRVHWRAVSDSAAAWIVAFSAVNTPLEKAGSGKIFLLHGPSQGSTPATTTGLVMGTADLGVRKYTVMWPNPHPDSVGSYIMLDPKLVIEDAPPDSVAAQDTTAP